MLSSGIIITIIKLRVGNYELTFYSFMIIFVRVAFFSSKCFVMGQIASGFATVIGRMLGISVTHNILSLFCFFNFSRFPKGFSQPPLGHFPLLYRLKRKLPHWDHSHFTLMQMNWRSHYSESNIKHAIGYSHVHCW